MVTLLLLSLSFPSIYSLYESDVSTQLSELRRSTWACIQILKPQIWPDYWHIAQLWAVRTHLQWHCSLGSLFLKKPWWEIKAGIQAKNQIPSLGKAEYLWLLWGQTKAQILTSPLTTIELWITSALAFSASLSVCWRLHLVPVTHSESWHTNFLSSLPTSEVAIKNPRPCWDSDVTSPQETMYMEP